MRRSGRVAACFAAGTLPCAACWAHPGFGDGASAGSGALHFLSAPVAWVAIAGLIAAIAGVNRSLALRCAVMAAAATGVAAARPALLPPWLPPLLAVLLGLAGVLRVPARARVAVPLALAAGLVAGATIALDETAMPAVLGAAVSMLLIVGAALAGYRHGQRIPRADRVLPLARRVLAAWVAAIAMLLLALALRAREPQPQALSSPFSSSCSVFFSPRTFMNASDS